MKQIDILIREFTFSQLSIRDQDGHVFPIKYGESNSKSGQKENKEFRDDFKRTTIGLTKLCILATRIVNKEKYVHEIQKMKKYPHVNILLVRFERDWSIILQSGTGKEMKKLLKSRLAKFHQEISHMYKGKGEFSF